MEELDVRGHTGRNEEHINKFVARNATQTHIHTGTSESELFQLFIHLL